MLRQLKVRPVLLEVFFSLYLVVERGDPPLQITTKTFEIGE